MKIILLISALILTTLGYTQTKTIAHKRHSGSKTSFSKSLYLEGLKGGPSNLGVGPEQWVRNSELKRVVFINDTTQAMITVESCTNRYDDSRRADLWRAGTDTVLRHPVFSTGISVDSMRSILKADYYFANEMSEVVFVDFDKRDSIERAEKEARKADIRAKTAERQAKRSKKTALGKYGWLLVVVASSVGIGIINLK